MRLKEKKGGMSYISSHNFEDRQVPLSLTLRVKGTSVSFDESDTVGKIVKTILQHNPTDEAPAILVAGSSSGDMQHIVSLLKSDPDSKQIKFKVLADNSEIISVTVNPKEIKKESCIEKAYELQAKKILLFGEKNFIDQNRIEYGRFNARQELVSGFIKDKDGNIRYIDPRLKLVTFVDDNRLGVFLYKENMYVLKEVDDERDYENVEYPIENFLLDALKERNPNYADMEAVLLHPSFIRHCPDFIKKLITPDNQGKLPILDLSDRGAQFILEMAKLLKIPLDPVDFFMSVIKYERISLLRELILLFPQEFEPIAPQIIENLLIRGEYQILEDEKIKDVVGAAESKLDSFHRMWVDIAKRNIPDDSFKKKFKSLSNDQKQILYDAAYLYNAPGLYEPPAVPVSLDQYSINLMWINREKISDDQLYLVGKEGDDEERQKQYFFEKLVLPVAGWAEKNPGSEINIWFDSKMVTQEAIDNSRKELLKFVASTGVGYNVNFRDVRNIESVADEKYGPLFNSSKLLFFKIDILKAMTADYTLRNRDKQYFVFVDLDIPPLSNEELFDTRTIKMLDQSGCVMAKIGGAKISKGGFGFENSFQIINGKDKLFMDEHRRIIIRQMLNYGIKRIGVVRAQDIYLRYPNLFNSYFHEKGDERGPSLDKIPRKPVNTPRSSHLLVRGFDF